MKWADEEIEEKRRRVLRDLRDLQKSKDKETAHGAADCSLTEILEALGEQEIVDEYEKIEKWYA